MSRLVALVLGVLAACGGANRDLRRAEQASYAAGREVVWSGVIASLATQFRGVEIAQQDGARLVTRWLATGRRVNQMGGGTSVISGNLPKGAKDEFAIELVRVTVLLGGTNPYRVAVDVEAGLYLSAARPPLVIAHGAEEPIWVPAKKEELELAIYDALHDFAHAP